MDVYLRCIIFTFSLWSFYYKSFARREHADKGGEEKYVCEWGAKHMSLYKGEYRASVSQGKERNLAIRFILSHKMSRYSRSKKFDFWSKEDRTIEAVCVTETGLLYIIFPDYMTTWEFVSHISLCPVSW